MYTLRNIHVCYFMCLLCLATKYNIWWRAGILEEGRIDVFKSVSREKTGGSNISETT